MHRLGLHLDEGARSQLRGSRAASIWRRLGRTAFGMPILIAVRDIGQELIEIESRPHASSPPFFLMSKDISSTYVDLSIHGSMLICQYSTAGNLAMPDPCSVTS